MTEEMGKPIAQAEAEIEKCAWGCDYYAENAERFLAPEPAPTDAAQSFVRFDPLGVVLAVMPWNFPFWQVFRFAAPALMAGNVGLLKHASNVPRCALAIEERVRGGGLPRRRLHHAHGRRFRRRNAHPASGCRRRHAHRQRSGGGVASGPPRARRSRRWCSSSADRIPSWCSPMPISRPPAATAVEARMINNGQSCIAAKRFIAVEPIADEFESRFASASRALKVGDPLDRSTAGRPARPPRPGARSRAPGADIGGRGRAGGGRRRTVPRTGLLLPAHPPRRRAPRHARSSTRRPSARWPRSRARADESAAIALANQSRFGLGASLWTRDTARAESLAARLEAGLVFVNGMVKSDPRLPFGGVKRSGHGRELGEIGIREFVNVKSVWVA